MGGGWQKTGNKRKQTKTTRCEETASGGGGEYSRYIPINKEKNLRHRAWSVPGDIERTALVVACVRRGWSAIQRNKS